MREVLHFGSLNNVMLIIFWRSFEYGVDDADGFKVEQLAREGGDLLGVFKYHLLLVGWLDSQGVRKSCSNLVARVNVFIGKIISENKMEWLVIGGENKSMDESSDDLLM